LQKEYDERSDFTDEKRGAKLARNCLDVSDILKPRAPHGEHAVSAKR